ncbi:hypothetical protein OG275_38230 (plasmid) [Streptomyces niveus]|uniref:hypothetical protein n=1 Tax=Streptomyces niveus TaxID=193462 RepID=UPI002E34AA48|nr:hypothetical protein [Streptomyces niveus]
MIPRGRPTLDIDGVAARAGVSVSTFGRRHRAAFAAAVKPLPGSKRPLLYDAAQVDAHLSGKPVPTLPKKPHPDDLLTDTETGAVVGVSASTIRADAATGRMDPGIERHGRRWWTRAAAEAEAARPPEYKGRTSGAKDRGSRRRPTADRTAAVAAELAAADADQGEPVTVYGIAVRYEVSTRTAERIIAEARRSPRQ